jgi:hypothetical protein
MNATWAQSKADLPPPTRQQVLLTGAFFLCGGIIFIVQIARTRGFRGWPGFMGSEPEKRPDTPFWRFVAPTYDEKKWAFYVAPAVGVVLGLGMIVAALFFME